MDISTLFFSDQALVLQQGCVDLHLRPVVPENLQDWGLLDAREQAKALAVRRPQDRAVSVQAHGLLRRVLSCYAPVAPPAWCFVRGPQGKPALCPHTHAAAQLLRFNVSHCADHIAVAVACGGEVGVDIERLDALTSADDLSGIMLSPTEQRSMPQEVRERQRFLLTRWTFKEAVLKALGMGLGSIDLAQFEVMPGAEGRTWHARPCTAPAAAHMVSWLEGGWLCGAAVGHTHHWALAWVRPSAHIDPALRVLHHPGLA